jgi:hypothetical protein
MILFALFAIVGCNQRDSQILSRETMTDLLVDIRISESRIQQYSVKNYKVEDIKKQSIIIYREVFNKHNTTYSQYQKSVEWYMKNSKIFKEISEEADKRLVEMRDSRE